MAFVPVLLLLMEWPDVQLARDVVQGFSLIGDMPHTGLWREVQEEPELSTEQLFVKAPEVRRRFHAERAPDPEEAEFLWAS